MVVRYETTYAISAYDHQSCEFESRSWWDVNRYNFLWLCLSLIAEDFPSPPVFSTNKTDRHDIGEILLKVALKTIALTTFAALIFFHLMTKNVFCESTKLTQVTSPVKHLIIYQYIGSIIALCIKTYNDKTKSTKNNNNNKVT